MCQRMAESSRQVDIDGDIQPFMDICINDITFKSELCNPTGAEVPRTIYHALHNGISDTRADTNTGEDAGAELELPGVLNALVPRLDAWRLIDGRPSCAAYARCHLPATKHSVLCEIHHAIARDAIRNPKLLARITSAPLTEGDWHLPTTTQGTSDLLKVQGIMAKCERILISDVEFCTLRTARRASSRSASRDSTATNAQFPQRSNTKTSTSRTTGHF